MKNIITTKGQKKIPLESNHTHFLLVDNAQVSYGGEINFRTTLEQKVAENNFKDYSTSSTTQSVKADDKIDDNFHDNIPIVVIVVEGGEGTFKTVFESIERRSPCVFVAVRSFKDIFVPN